METKNRNEYYLHSIDPSINRYRYYTVFLQENLFGSYLLIRHWGRIGRRGKSSIMTFDSPGDARPCIDRIIKIRKRHNYIEARM